MTTSTSADGAPVAPAGMERAGPDDAVDWPATKRGHVMASAWSHARVGLAVELGLSLLFVTLGLYLYQRDLFVWRLLALPLVACGLMGVAHAFSEIIQIMRRR